MPVEVVLPLGLSGAEYKKAILDRVARALNRNCHLNDNLAYPDGISYEIHMKIRGTDIGRQMNETMDIEGAVKPNEKGDKLVDTDPQEYAALEAAEVDIEINAHDPNEERVQTGQPVPVKTTDRQGRDSVRMVEYARGKKAK